MSQVLIGQSNQITFRLLGWFNWSFYSQISGPQQSLECVLYSSPYQSYLDQKYSPYASILCGSAVSTLSTTVQSLLY